MRPLHVTRIAPHVSLLFVLGLAVLLPGGCSTLLDARDPVGVCGDHIEQPNETCDDGNAVDGDGCSATCQLEYCGNGILDPHEECDESPGNDDNGDCTRGCKRARCGDGLVKTRGEPPFEACDDGNSVNGDGCNPDCALQGRLSVIAGASGGRGIADGIGSAARFADISALATDTHNAFVYIADQGACALRRLRIATGDIETIAGQVDRCGSDAVGDGPGTQARFTADPKRMAVVGNTLFVGEGNLLRTVDLNETDCGNHCFTVRSCRPIDRGAGPARYEATHAISAMTASRQGDALFVATPSAVYRIALPCRCDGLGFLTSGQCSAELLVGHADPLGIATDGNVPQARLGWVRGLAADPTQDLLYIADLVLLRKFDLSTGRIETVAGGLTPFGHIDGQGRDSARFHELQDLVYADGTLFAIEQAGEYDTSNNSLALLSRGWANIRQVDPSGWRVTTLAGTVGTARLGSTPESDGFGPQARFAELRAATVAGGTLYVGGGSALRAVAPASAQVALAAGQLVQDFTYYLSRTAVSLDGTLYALGRDDRIHALALDRAAPVRRFDVCKSDDNSRPVVRGLAPLSCPDAGAGVCGALEGPALLVADVAIGGLCRVDLTGSHGQPCCDGCLETCEQVLALDRDTFHSWGVSAIAHDGANIYLLARSTKQLIRVSLGVSPTTTVIQPGEVFQNPLGMTYAGRHLYVSDQQANVIFRIDPTNGAVRTIGSGRQATEDGSREAASFCHPLGVVATHAALGRAAASESDTPLAPNRLFVGEAFCELTRELFNGHAIRQIDLETLEVSTLVGPGPEPFLLEGVGRQASVNWPASLTADQTTHALYLADMWENVLVRIE